MLSEILIVLCLSTTAFFVSLYDWIPEFYKAYLEAQKITHARNWLKHQCSNPYTKDQLTHYTDACNELNLYKQHDDQFAMAWKQAKPKLPFLVDFVIHHVHWVTGGILFSVVFAVISGYMLKKRTVYPPIPKLARE